MEAGLNLRTENRLPLLLILMILPESIVLSPIVLIINNSDPDHDSNTHAISAVQKTNKLKVMCLN